MSQTCPEKDLTVHDPPLVYDLSHDPFEMFELPPDQVPQGLLEKAALLVDLHKSGVEPVPDQMGHKSQALVPCCNFPTCRCDELDEEFELVRRRVNYLYAPLSH